MRNVDLIRRVTRFYAVVSGSLAVLSWGLAVIAFGMPAPGRQHQLLEPRGAGRQALDIFGFQRVPVALTAIALFMLAIALLFLTIALSCRRRWALPALRRSTHVWLIVTPMLGGYAALAWWRHNEVTLATFTAQPRSILVGFGVIALATCQAVIPFLWIRPRILDGNLEHLLDHPNDPGAIEPGRRRANQSKSAPFHSAQPPRNPL